MDREPMEDIPVNEQVLQPEETPAPEMAHQPATGSIWRVVLVIGVLVVIAVLAYTLIQPRLALQTGGEVQVSPQAEPSLVGPQATAEANPDSAQAQFELGNTYARGGQWDQALAAYQKAIELDPNYQSAYANLGVVYYQLEQLDLAESQYQKALELNPDDGEVAYNLGALYLQQALLSGEQPEPARLEQAIQQLQHAAELEPDLAEPYFSLGVAYKEAGQTEQAIEAFETFLARDSARDPRANQEAQKHLDELRNQ